MSDNTNTSTHKKSTHVRTSSRRNGIRLTKAQTEHAQDTFLKSFAANGNVRAACLQAGIDRSTVHHWNEHDEQFSMRYNLAKEDVNDAIRAEIYRRGMFGDERFVVSMGKIVYEEIPLLNKDGTPKLNDRGGQVYGHGKPLTIREKSDTLLIFHAKARMPEYRDKAPTVAVVLPKEYVNLPEDGVTE